MKPSAIVLAGGSSRRMGVKKAFLEVGGRSVIIRVLDVLSLLSSDVMVVVDRRDRFTDLGARIVEDEELGRGPLMGLYSGLKAARFPLCVAVACDMPFLNAGLLRYMVRLASGFDAVVLDDISSEKDRIQPLHAIYSKRCLPTIEKLLKEGEDRLESLLHLVQVRYVPRAEREAFDPQNISTWNLNTPQDLYLAREFLEKTRLDFQLEATRE